MIIQLGVLFVVGSMTVTSALPPCFCAKDMRPVCGSDGHTYNNECLLHCAQLSNPELLMTSNGKCGTNCGCTLEYKPVCGTDGETYDNICSLECLSWKNPDLRMHHEGSCENNIPCSCTFESNPVCGSDGNTYENPCVLKCAKESKKNLIQSHVGECDDRATIIHPSACLCTREARPVCGTDGKNYGNPCMLNCARLADENLHIAYVGYCEDKGFVKEFDDMPCSCTKNLRPVCASNGVTFRNECLMRCLDDHLTVFKDEPCED